MMIKYLSTYRWFPVVLLVVSCIHDPSPGYLKNIQFDEERKILILSEKSDPDTSLQQIIVKSGIRKDGYGILLVADELPDDITVSALKKRFIKQDINAVHIYKLDPTFENNELAIAAIKGARFTWVHASGSAIFNTPGWDTIVQELKESAGNGGITVISSGLYRSFRESFNLQ